MARNDGNQGEADGWEDRVRTASTSSDPEVVRSLVRDVYRTAQDELDAQRAQAEFEREE
ncbi:hypothetical protein ABZ341_26520 [Streptomyces sp. NPDC006173]|uniref:hypothetical protein n=1 Tax=unclassified Streptomyces TaxID=2593676 RepID=UPI0033E7A7C9